MKNRGQVTIFVILGLVMLVVIISVLIISSSFMKKETSSEIISIEEGVSDVREYVTSCLDESLENAVIYCLQAGNCPSFEEDLRNKVFENFYVSCRNFLIFQNIEVEEKEGLSEDDVKIIMVTEGGTDRTKVRITVGYPIAVKKDGTEHILGATEPFFSEYSFIESGCVPIQVDRDDCTACNDFTDVGGIPGISLTGHGGDFVGLSDTICFACPSMKVEECP